MDKLLMTRKRKLQSISLSIGDDPALWKFESLQEAILESTNILSQLILTEQEVELAKEIIANQDESSSEKK